MIQVLNSYHFGKNQNRNRHIECQYIVNILSNISTIKNYLNELKRNLDEKVCLYSPTSRPSTQERSKRQQQKSGNKNNLVASPLLENVAYMVDKKAAVVMKLKFNELIANIDQIIYDYEQADSR